MTIRITGLVAKNNGGDGLRIEGDAKVEVTGVLVEGNGGQGVNILRHAGLLEQLGLPKDTDPLELAALLERLQTAPEPQRLELVHSSGILAKIGKGALDLSTLASNLVSVATNPAVGEIIKRLAGGA